MKRIEKVIVAALEPVVREVVEVIRRIGKLEALGENLVKGDKGDQGDKGDRGDNGKDGDSPAVGQIVEYLINSHWKALKGEDGKDGDRGEKGDKGDQGDKGLDGTSPDPGEIITRLVTDHREALRGERGEKGLQGDKGDKGDKGEDGRHGVSPDPGEIVGRLISNHGEALRGERGEKGLQGDKGLKGDQGDKGDKGDQGDKGLDGASPAIQDIVTRLMSNHAQELKGERGNDGDKGDQGDKGLKGEDGKNGIDGIGIDAVEVGEGEFDLVFTNKERATIKLPNPVKGEQGDKGDKGDKGELGEMGLGINSPMWVSGVYREHSIVQHDLGRYYIALKDTANEPGDKSGTWQRIGKNGFRHRGVKKADEHYEDGDFFIDEGSTFLVVNGKPKMFAQRGKDGTNGTNGKDGAMVKEIAVDEDGFLVMIRSDGQEFTADIRSMLQPVVHRMVVEQLSSMGVIVGGG